MISPGDFSVSSFNLIPILMFFSSHTGQLTIMMLKQKPIFCPKKGSSQYNDYDRKKINWKSQQCYDIFFSIMSYKDLLSAWKVDILSLFMRCIVVNFAAATASNTGGTGDAINI